MKLALIVEGHGDVFALPVLVQRAAAEIDATSPPEILRPAHRIPRGKLANKPNELQKAIEFQARRVGAAGGILVVLDADEDCPAQLGPSLLAVARAQRPHTKIAVVVAKREFEAWFLAGALSLRGKRGLREDLEPPAEPEDVVDAKGWLSSRMKRRYSETLDQVALSHELDLGEAAHAPSFGKFMRDLRALLAGAGGTSGPS